MFENSTLINEYKWLNNYASLYKNNCGFFLDSNNLRCALTLLPGLPQTEGYLYINKAFARYANFFYICEENPCGGSPLHYCDDIFTIKYKSKPAFPNGVIDSKKHPAILEYKQRGEANFVIEGERLIKRAIDDRLMLKNIIYNSKSPLANNGGIKNAACPCYLSNEGIMSALSTSKPVPSEIALAVLPEYTPESIFYGEYSAILVTDSVENPDNLGLVIRTADACGADAVIVTGTGAAPYHKNCVRASRGALGRLPIIHFPDGESLISKLKSNGITVIGTSARADRSIYNFTPPKKFAAVIGSESFGMTPEISNLCDLMLTIPMANGQSSLNVAVAAGLVLSASFQNLM